MLSGIQVGYGKKEAFGIKMKGIIIKISKERVETSVKLKGLTLQEWSLLIAEMERIKHDMMDFDLETVK